MTSILKTTTSTNVFFLLLISISAFSHSSHAVDFCIADLTNGPQTSTGYPCKDPANVTVDDFVFSGFVNPGDTSNLDKSSVNRPRVPQFPALNGMGLAVSRVDIGPNGALPLHAHPRSAEIVHVAVGAVLVGFISGNPANTVYVKKLKTGELMVIPQGLLHFQVNYGTENAVVFGSFGNVDPGVQVVRTALFGNDLASLLVEKSTGIDVAEVKKLKALLGGSG